MLGKAFARLTGQHTHKAVTSQNNNDLGLRKAPSISKMLSVSGRIGIQMLRNIHQSCREEDFIRLFLNPVLLGSGIYSGTLNSREKSGPADMNRTVIFEPMDDGDDEAEASESLSQAVYPLVKSEYAAATGPVFSIGRVDGNDLIMPDFAISKTHATIEIKRDMFWLADCGSTNGTTLNGQPVGKKPVKINDGDKISFARYEFKLSSPKSLYNWLNEN